MVDGLEGVEGGPEDLQGAEGGGWGTQEGKGLGTVISLGPISSDMETSVQKKMVKCTICILIKPLTNIEIMFKFSLVWS